jgi:hypothetical protein
MKNTLLIITTILFSNTCLLHGMELEIPIKKETLREKYNAIFMSSESKNCTILNEINSQSTTYIKKPSQSNGPNIITTYSRVPSIMTVLYVKYKNGDQFAGVTRYSWKNFLSDFSTISEDLKQLFYETTAKNNIMDMETTRFWYLQSYDLITELSKENNNFGNSNVYSQNQSTIFDMLKEYYQREDKPPVIPTQINFPHFKDTNISKIDVSLYLHEGFIRLNDDKNNTFYL